MFCVKHPHSQISCQFLLPSGTFKCLHYCRQDKSKDREEGGVMLLHRAAKMDEAVFREKLKNMGQKSKRKFAQLAGMFSRRKGAKQLLDQVQ
jgi:hypothetical protein